MNAKVAYDDAHAALINDLYPAIKAGHLVRIAVGFISPAGVRLIHSAVTSNPDKVQDITVGSAGWTALRALANLDSILPPNRVYVHLGWDRPDYTVGIFRPMLHSKIYYIESGSKAKAFVGSNNLTEFALSGANCEASIILEATVDDPEMQSLRRHLDHVKRESRQFDSNDMELYARWYHNSLEQYIDIPPARDPFPDHTRTLIILSECDPHAMPKGGDVVYFEHIEEPWLFDLSRDVHLYLFPPGTLVGKPGRKDVSKATLFRGRLVKSGFTGRQGAIGTPSSEPNIEWLLPDLRAPMIQPAPLGGIDHTSVTGQMQVKIELDINNPVAGIYEYSDGSNVRQVPLRETYGPAFSLGGLLAEQREFGERSLSEITNVWKDELEVRWKLVSDLYWPEEELKIRPDVFGGRVTRKKEREMRNYIFSSPRRKHVA